MLAGYNTQHVRRGLERDVRMRGADVRHRRDWQYPRWSKRTATLFSGRAGNPFEVPLLLHGSCLQRAAIIDFGSSMKRSISMLASGKWRL
jgi:hypothetical protein